MRNVLGPGTTLGYCTNVHAGTTLAAIRDNLERYALAVKARVCPDEPLGIGLWLPASAAHDMAREGSAPAFRQWLDERGLFVFTMNGFPYGDFHEPVVKHSVYRPNWTERERAAYTRNLVHILADLVPEGGEGSISTVPLGWGDLRPADRMRAISNLARVTAAAVRVEAERGTLIHIDVEPEPGCALQRTDDVLALFRSAAAQDTVVRRHLRVCHDICHAAVMFESQDQVLAQYAAARVEVGKVQISSAIHVPWSRQEDGAEARAYLERFAEDRYLHQTTDVRGAFWDDLPLALAQHPVAPSGCSSSIDWRVHYHVPIHLEAVGPLTTTRTDIDECLAAIRTHSNVRHFEVETYAWDVLPPSLRGKDLAEGIAAELAWVRERHGYVDTPDRAREGDDEGEGT